MIAEYTWAGGIGRAIGYAATESLPTKKRHAYIDDVAMPYGRGRAQVKAP
jgi:hypothetical protein